MRFQVASALRPGNLPTVLVLLQREGGPFHQVKSCSPLKIPHKPPFSTLDLSGTWIHRTLEPRNILSSLISLHLYL